jgi:CrcB-like protein, Camphor Resistance (CrcB)
VLTWVGVGVFGALGAVARFWLDAAVSARMPSTFPLGTLTVNLTGSFALGVGVGAALTHRLALVLGTGFMGGLHDVLDLDGGERPAGRGRRRRVAAAQPLAVDARQPPARRPARGRFLTALHRALFARLAT